MITVTVGIILTCLLFALLISQVEQKSGFMGDSSVVPGCLGVMIVVLLIVNAWGLYTGLIQITFQ